MAGRLARTLRGLFVPGSIRAREDERWFFVDPLPSGSYNHQFLRSRAEGDFVRHPDYLWSPTPYWTARGGLNGHLRELADRLGGTVYSDVLLVLHPEDCARTESSMLRSWRRAAQDELAECFERLVRAQGWAKASPQRPLQLRVLRDGDPALGATLGLAPGEFATALLPNLYLGPVAGSAPLVEVFAADERGRFSPLGTLYSDQLAFTVGAHALDNGRLDRLGDSAVYTVHRLPGEPGLHHRVNGERADRLVIETGSAHGGETVRVVDRGRDKVLLEVMLVAARELDAELPEGDEAGPRPLIGLPGFLPGADSPGTILPEGLDLGALGAFSIIPDALPQAIHTLSERGFLLQKLHFGAEMRGYTVDIDRRGEVGPAVGDPVVTLEVAGDRLTAIAVARDVSIDGVPLRPGARMPLRSPEHHVVWRDGELDLQSLRRPHDPRWPYLARLGTPRRSTPLSGGEEWAIGRDAESCDVPLPDRPLSTNILWRDGRTSGPVEVQGGRVDRATFRTDAICVASRAAVIDLSEDVPRLHNSSQRCWLHVLRGDEAIRVSRGGTLALESGDELLIGNHVFALLAPGEVEAKRQAAPAQLVPASERLEQGPGARGRRPKVGGRAGKLVQPERTVRAALAGSPERGSVPVRAKAPEAIAHVVIEPVVTEGPPPRNLADLPTHCLPSISLDRSVASGTWLQGSLEDLSLDAAPTVVDDEPDWGEMMQRASSAGPTREMPPPELPGLPPVPEPASPARVVPRGLRLDPVISPEVGLRRRRNGFGLPGFGLRPNRPPPPSMPGD